MNSLRDTRSLWFAVGFVIASRLRIGLGHNSHVVFTLQRQGRQLRLRLSRRLGTQRRRQALGGRFGRDSRRDRPRSISK